MMAAVFRIVWALVSLGAFIYIMFSEETPGWGRALAIMLAIGLWQIDMNHERRAMQR